MRVIVFGTGDFAVPSLEQVVAHRHTVVLCVTQPDRPQGRGLAQGPSPVKRTALRLGIPLAQPERLSLHDLPRATPEIGVAVDYGQLIRRELLAWPTHGILGVHPSLLPKYRGAAPVNWALLNGETTTGVTIYRLNERMDAGEIVVQQATPIDPSEDAAVLTGRLAGVGAEALLRALELVASGRAVFTPQDDSRATVAPQLTKAHGRIVWDEPAETIARVVRGTMPWPGAATAWRTTPLKVWAARAEAASRAAGRPGQIVAVLPEGIAVATGRGVLVLTELQPAGRRRMTAREFLAGHAVQVGDIVGA